MTYGSAENSKLLREGREAALSQLPVLSFLAIPLLPICINFVPS